MGTIPVGDERHLQKLKASLDDVDAWEPKHYHASDIAFLIRLVEEAKQNVQEVAVPAEIPKWLAFFAGGGISITLIGLGLIISKMIYLLFH